jgi:murein L,D-transpeptidase YcbB/YkuD
MSQHKNRQSQPHSPFGLIVASLILASCPQNSGQPAREASLRGGLPLADARGSVQRGSVQHLSPEGEASLRGWIDSGRLADLRWPDFSDYRVHVTNFYAPAGYALAWVRDGRATPQAAAVTEVLAQADSKGLAAEDYDASRWPDWMARLRRSKPEGTPVSDSDLAKFDLALTVCVMRYISDLHIGKVNPKTFHFGLDIEGKKYNLPDFLRQRLVGADAGSIKTVLDSVEPPFAAYQRTQKALQIYQGLAQKDDGEQLPIPKTPVKPGDAYQGVARLVRLLRLVGDMPPEAAVNSDQQIFEGAVVDAVKRFQLRHGLDPSGRLTAETAKQLNVPLGHRAEQLRLTLERWRWIPHEFDRPPIIVNIPEFILRGWNQQQHAVVQMKVVVGKAYHHKTPVFSNRMRYVVFRPYWNVPPGIQRNEMVPKIEKDPGYLAKEDLEVVDRSGQVVTAGTVNADVLQRLRSGQLAIRQRPGPKNSLGLAKFLFPNEYNVYLHGTPATELFEKSRRDFSHGCIRVQDPAGLAVWVLPDKPEWTRDRIVSAMNGDHPVQVNLDRPIPVLIVYGTAVVLENGEAHFFEDIYGYDAELEAVLAKGYPYPG